MKSSSSNLKAKLGHFMKAVKRGQEVVITDRNEPVAKLVPYIAKAERLPIRPPELSGSLAKLKIKGALLKNGSSLDLLKASRGDH